jgi:hypothetical protein
MCIEPFWPVINPVRHLFDTNACIHLMKLHEPLTARSAGPSTISITAITLTGLSFLPHDRPLAYMSIMSKCVVCGRATVAKVIVAVRFVACRRAAGERHQLDVLHRYCGAYVDTEIAVGC